MDYRKRYAELAKGQAKDAAGESIEGIAERLDGGSDIVGDG
jgi:hypothetical protein